MRSRRWAWDKGPLRGGALDRGLVARPLWTALGRADELERAPHRLREAVGGAARSLKFVHLILPCSSLDVVPKPCRKWAWARAVDERPVAERDVPVGRSMTVDIAERVSSAPLIRPEDVEPSHPDLEVVSVLNPAAACVDGHVQLLLRVAERPRRRTPPPGALTLDLNATHPHATPLRRRYDQDEVVPITLLDTAEGGSRLVVAYLPKELPGLDASDPRGVSFVHPATGRRMVFLTQFSHLRCARSADGSSFAVDPRPTIFPDGPLEEYGCEDARATLIDGVWHVTYVSVSRAGITTSLVTTRDFRRFERHGVILPPDLKDVALFPERRHGQLMALTRPMPSSFGHVLGIWLALPDPRTPWGRHVPVVMPRTGRWDEKQTGASTVPFRVRDGWLEIYHGVDNDHRYTLGAVLLDGADPSRVIARSPEPILMPELPFEMEGLFGNVVYSCGHVPLDDEGKRIRVYYGAADSCVAAADFVVEEIIDTLESA